MGSAAGYDTTVIGVCQLARNKRSDRVITGCAVICKTESLRHGVVLLIWLKSGTGFSRSALYVECQTGRFKTINTVGNILAHGVNDRIGVKRIKHLRSGLITLIKLHICAVSRTTASDVKHVIIVEGGMYRQAPIDTLNGNPLLRTCTVSHILLNITTRLSFTARDIKHQARADIFKS